MIDIALAVALDWIIGDPYWFPHPVIYMGKLIGLLEKAGRKICKKNIHLRLFGGFIVLITCSISFTIPFTLLHLTKGFPLVYHSLNVLLLWTTLAAKSLHKEGIKVYHSLVNGDLEDARLKLSYIVGRETVNLKEEEIIRADVETIAENSSDGVIAPLLFAMIGGAPLAFLYKAVNTMDSMLGYLNERYRYIGFFPAKVDDVFNFIPARITGLLICAASPMVGGNILDSFKIMFRDRRNHKSPNCAYPEAAAAGALGIQIGGANTYFGEIVYKPTIGDMKNKLNNRHIVDTIKLMYGSEIILTIIYFLMVMLYGR